MGPRCPACGANVKLPKGAPLPPPHAKVKCPSCGSVGQLEAFLRAAALAEEPVPAAEARAVAGATPEAEAPTDQAGGGTPKKPILSDSESGRTLPIGSRFAPPGTPMPPQTGVSAGAVAESAVPAGSAAESDGATRIAGSAKKLDLPPGIRCVLSVLSGPDSGKKMELDRPRVVVGRGTGDFPLSDRDVSKEHCAFEITGVSCTVKDLGSKNGTFVEGQRISSHLLSNVGEVVVGNTTLLFTMTLDDGPRAA